MMTKKISVIVPTYNRVSLLEKTLVALVGQKFPANDFEIIVCDDGSTDSTRELVRIFSKNYKNPEIVYLHQKNRGPAAARNLGIKESKASIIAMTDDDCQPDRDWLKTIWQGFQANSKAVALSGITYTKKDKITPFTHQIDNSEPWSFPTCNLACQKILLEKINGFDEKFPFTNEDADLSWRIEAEGRVVHLSQMRVLHPPRPTTFMKNLKTIKYLESEFLLQEKMPEEYKKRKINPYREILFVHGLKIGAKKIIRFSGWIFKNPFLYVKLIILIITERLYLLFLLPGFMWRHWQRSI
jgi:glycosyltransferase involved in cell wall biosynthesis